LPGYENELVCLEGDKKIVGKIRTRKKQNSSPFQRGLGGFETFNKCHRKYFFLLPVLSGKKEC
jgi:hypothetical protein